MLGSVIILKGTLKERREKAVELASNETGKNITWDQFKKNPDFYLVEKTEDRQSIGIKQVKEGIVFLQERPLALKNKVLLIDTAEILTDDAQNALLKTLEEPPAYALILLLAKTENSLLPTIQSRCKKIDCEKSEGKNHTTAENTPDEKGKEVYSAKKFLEGDLAYKLGVVEELSKEDRDEVIEILENWVREAHKSLLNKSISNSEANKIANNIKNITKLISDFENTNAQLKLGLEWLCLNLE